MDNGLLNQHKYNDYNINKSEESCFNNKICDNL